MRVYNESFVAATVAATTSLVIITVCFHPVSVPLLTSTFRLILLLLRGVHALLELRCGWRALSAVIALFLVTFCLSLQLWSETVWWFIARLCVSTSVGRVPTYYAAVRLELRNTDSDLRPFELKPGTPTTPAVGQHSHQFCSFSTPFSSRVNAPARTGRTDGRTGKTRIAAYGDGRPIGGWYCLSLVHCVCVFSSCCLVDVSLLQF